MNELQKVIKYAAIVFAIFLCVNIISAIIWGASLIFGITTGISAFSTKEEITQGRLDFAEDYSEIRSLKIDIEVAKLNIKSGDKVRVEASEVTNNFISKLDGTTLVIEEKGFNHKWFNFNNNTPEITIYLPDKMELSDIMIKSGVSSAYIDCLIADDITLKLGVGSTKINYISADTLKIEGGVGKVEIENSDVNNVDAETGVGSFSYKGLVNEFGDFSTGVGKADIVLTGKSDEYKIKTNTGIGSMNIDGKRASDNQIFGNGLREIKIDGGIGAILVDFEE